MERLAAPAPDRRREAGPTILLEMDLRGQLVTVVGGGEVAERKVALFADAGARIRCIAKEFSTGILQLPAVERIQFNVPADHRRIAPLLQGSKLVIAATDTPDVNIAAARASRELGILVNVVDVPELCDVFIPAIVRRGDVVIGIGTAGVSPGLSRYLREKISEVVGEEYARMAELQGDLRQELRAVTKTPEERKDRILRVLDDEEIWALLRAERIDQAIKRARELTGLPP